MLTFFGVKNFLSIKDFQYIDFRKKAGLNTVGIFGENGSGKTNMLSAMNSFFFLLCRGASRSPTSKESKKHESPIPFLFNESSKDLPIEFSVELEIDGLTYEFILSVKSGHVVKEELSLIEKEKRYEIYKRGVDKEDWVFSIVNIPVKFKIPKEAQSTAKNILSKDIVFLTHMSKSYEIDYINNFYDYFGGSNIGHFWVSSYQTAALESANEKVKNNENYRTKLLKFLNLFSLRIAKLEYRDGNIVSFHKNSDGREYSIPFDFESKGTQQIYILADAILQTLERGSFLMIDEIDAHLHHDLIKKIFLMFNDETSNPKNAKLVFTAHDLLLMEKDTLDREGIMVAKMDSDQSTYYVSSDEFSEIRGDMNFRKSYMDGRVGGVPIFANDSRFVDMVKELLTETKDGN